MGDDTYPENPEKPIIIVYIMTHFRIPEFKRNNCLFEGDCRQDIQKSAKRGDWVIGVGGKDFHEQKMIYAMKVTKTHPLKSNYCKNYKDNPKLLPMYLDGVTAGLKDRKNRTKGRWIRDPKIYSKFDGFMRKQITEAPKYNNTITQHSKFRQNDCRPSL